MITTTAKILKNEILPLIREQNVLLAGIYSYLISMNNPVHTEILEQILEVTKDIHNNTRELIP